jgi:ABC-2 type transport system ATP-binding protein/lipopolysaccharide transport system ATP-binding protein
MSAVIVKDVKKYYKKFSNKHKFQTLKSAFLDRSLFASLKNSEKSEVLKGINFEVKAGKTLSIIGQNGSGKSTMLKILAGITKPTEGSLTVRGRVSALIELGAGFHPEISGRENIFINGIILGLPRRKIEEKYDDIVKFAELEEHIEKPVKTYSSGMFMRLGFSIAINVDPDILLIDEVLAVGDASFVPKCIDKINEFKRNGKTIIFVSHDLSTVERISDEVIWLKEGKIEMVGYPKKVTDKYLEYIGKKDEKKAEEQHEEEEEQARETRWGGKEIEIFNVKMFDGRGREKYIFEPEEALEIRFDVRANSEQKDFVFGLGIFNSGGQQCYGSNTYIESYKSLKISGTGTVRVSIPALNLVNGTYFLDLAVHKIDGYPYDYHHFQYTFKVTSIHRDVGVVRVKHSWDFPDNIKMKDENIQ